MDILFDMETQDPDDIFTLCFLLGHPGLTLRTVTINPGSLEQVGLVRGVLEKLGRGDIPVGARNPQTTSKCISDFHYSFLGQPTPDEPDAVAHELLAQMLSDYPDAVWLTGAPLHNARLLLANHPSVTIRRWVGQGGFAGDSLVPPEHRLPQFVGRETCVSHNLSVDPKGAFSLLRSERVLLRDLVSKNVCHGVRYDAAMSDRMAPYRDISPSLALIYTGMECYFREIPEGKMFHDPLAACVAVDRNIATFEEVEIYQERGEWGARRATGTNTFITVAVDHERFFQTLVMH
ncbi:nucleoside hydrolase [Aetokthonos hydrillicola Thurmond2011]|jgi:pyrimidine-specific ribonucleoside hydrolase|uniref:Nucleoside hydrolase n=1 Tax=Aetokthonos hydrillicola Thurmond2011 TaxID=2712845 RepID=A0AAP5I910_9CYAN|nr:nucleoside hydrolase [Aetokthonos hydrillicola]MBO3463565.1 nucleoside hydrolase [Aetokthonos hydrillicola CCALA 1050]MBW4588707.1 nucleoside hydrolase [Aetokthonos hydrillicola CCALA 1050]MDR9895959.1 nucleoside hydrolase [Aetokthonos hydrillicola Thurmond2011]